jgi:hypothetical protein
MAQKRKTNEARKQRNKANGITKGNSKYALKLLQRKRGNISHRSPFNNNGRAVALVEVTNSKEERDQAQANRERGAK